jgi:hypothetical protein
MFYLFPESVLLISGFRQQVVINFGDRENSCGISYVAISRVKKLSGLMLMDFPKKRLTEKVKTNAMIIRNQREKEIYEAIPDITMS